MVRPPPNRFAGHVAPAERGKASFSRRAALVAAAAKPAAQDPRGLPKERHAMTIAVGDTLPAATFMVLTADGPKPMSTADVFGGKTVALFAVPGAYTPTCSAKHLPSYKDKGAELKAKGVDTIACLSVNDMFVMNAWAKEQGVDGEILMLADGNGDFAKAIGLEMDGTKFGMGVRAQRFSLLAKDGVVTHLFVEAPAEYKVSSAEHMLAEI
jgi:glutaredoxin/glutathione-dependent peroxiredoxin